MTQRDSDEKRKINRRVFIQYSAATSGAAMGVYAMTLKTDAIEQPSARSSFGVDDGTMSYPYK